MNLLPFRNLFGRAPRKDSATMPPTTPGTTEAAFVPPVALAPPDPLGDAVAAARARLTAARSAASEARDDVTLAEEALERAEAEKTSALAAAREAERARTAGEKHRLLLAELEALDSGIGTAAAWLADAVARRVRTERQLENLAREEGTSWPDALEVPGLAVTDRFPLVYALRIPIQGAEPNVSAAERSILRF